MLPVEFIRQLQIVVRHQHLKLKERLLIVRIMREKSDYKWLISDAKLSPDWQITNSNEFLMMQALNQLNENEILKVWEKLLNWISNHPDITSQEMIQICIELLTNAANNSLIKNTTVARISRYRDIWWKIRCSLMNSNKIFPST